MHHLNTRRNKEHIMSPFHRILAGAILLLILMPNAFGAKEKSMNTDGVFNPKSYGAKIDGTTDDTPAIQAALDAAAKVGGSVSLTPGKWLVKGSLKIPAGVDVKGSANAPRYSEPLKGTIILATGGRDKED